MAGNGPPPNPNARRRNARVGVVRLPAGGREGDPPVWPLPRPTVYERRVWAELWALPQAVAWERLGWTRVVARYVRVLKLADTGNLPASAEARQFEDRLGLTPKAMRSLMWEVAADEVAQARVDAQPAGRVRRRLKVVGGDAVAAD